MTSEFQQGVNQGRTEASLEGLATSVDDVLMILRGPDGRGGVVGDVQSLKEFRHNIVIALKTVGGVLGSSAVLGAFLKIIGVLS